jgi:hypothetical protein
MAQVVTVESFTLKELQTEAGIAKLNMHLFNLTTQIQAMQGTIGKIQPDADIDMRGLYRVINQKP